MQIPIRGSDLSIHQEQVQETLRDTNHESTLQVHFKSGEYASRNMSNMKIQILHVLDDPAQPIAEAEELKMIETLWIDRLMSQHPQGLNRIRQDPNKRY